MGIPTKQFNTAFLGNSASILTLKAQQFKTPHLNTEDIFDQIIE